MSLEALVLSGDTTARASSDNQPHIKLLVIMGSVKAVSSFVSHLQ